MVLSDRTCENEGRQFQILCGPKSSEQRDTESSTSTPTSRRCAGQSGRAKFFSTLDMASGYWQVDLADEDKEKTAFTTGKGLHQFRAMPLGLKNAGATFQRLMELVLAGMDSRSCLVYIDDIIVFGETEQAHLKNLEEVFQRIRDAGMKLKPRKCCLARDEVVFLGHKVSQTGVQPDPANIAKMTEWPRPEKTEGLKSFLGLTGYYARFVPDYSDLAKPIREESERRATLNGRTS